MDALSVVIIGHVDHGKSTFIGRLLYDAGALSKEKMAKINNSGNCGGEFELAHTMDSFEEERLLGMTMDTSSVSFSYGNRQYTIIDVPGHYELLAKMVTGANCADAAILVVDVLEGLQSQTKLHCHVLSRMNIRQVIVLINKMDLVGYSRVEFDRRGSTLVAFLKSVNICPQYIIPISAKLGDNITTKSLNVPWYSGATVLAALDSLTPSRPATQELCFPVQDIYELDGERIVVGRVESGRMSSGQGLLLLPAQTRCGVREIKRYGKTDIQEAEQGECIGITVEDVDASALKRGAVFTDSANFRVGSKVRGRVFWITDAPCIIGNRYSICCATQSVNGAVVGITNRVQVSTANEVVHYDSVDSFVLGEVADVELELDCPLVFQTKTTLKLSNFVLKKDGVLIAGEGYFLE